VQRQELQQQTQPQPKLRQVLQLQREPQSHTQQQQPQELLQRQQQLLQRQRQLLQLQRQSQLQTQQQQPQELLQLQRQSQQFFQLQQLQSQKNEIIDNSEASYERPTLTLTQIRARQAATESPYDDEAIEVASSIRKIEDWNDTFPHRLANSWMELTLSRCYNEKRAVAGLVHLAHTAIVAGKAELLIQLLAIFSKHKLRFDVQRANFRLNELGRSVEPLRIAASTPDKVASFSSHVRGVPISECPVLYFNVLLGRSSICDANPIFLKNVLDLISPEDTFFDICARIFFIHDLPKVYETLAIIIAGIANEVAVSVRLRDDAECDSGWLVKYNDNSTYNDIRKPIPTEARFRLELSPDGSEARYALCLLPQPKITHDELQPAEAPHPSVGAEYSSSYSSSDASS